MMDVDENGDSYFEQDEHEVEVPGDTSESTMAQNQRRVADGLALESYDSTGSRGSRTEVYRCEVDEGSVGGARVLDRYATAAGENDLLKKAYEDN